MPPKQIPMRTAKEQLPRLVREASLGAKLTITVHGRPLADLVPHVADPETPRSPRSLPPRVKLSSGTSLDEVLDDVRADR